MKVITKLVFVDEQEEKFFGEGPYQLLRKVEETGSLRAAAISIGMAYSKATNLLNHAEKSLGFPLTVRKIGGKSGGGSVLTKEAEDFLQKYESFRTECVKHSKLMYEKYFEGFDEVSNVGKAGDDDRDHGGCNASDLDGSDENQSPQFGCVIMASGMGKRFGGDKLMTILLGKPMIQYIVEATEGLFLHRVVVTRNEAVQAWCKERNIPVVCHELPGRNDTVRLGIEAFMEANSVKDEEPVAEMSKKNENGMQDGSKKTFSGCVFCPADMPFVNRNSLRKLLAMASENGEGIYRMAYQGTCGSPVLFTQKYFEPLKELPEGKGGSEIIKANKENVYLVEAKEACELWDMDTKEDFVKIEEKMREKLI